MCRGSLWNEALRSMQTKKDLIILFTFKSWWRYLNFNKNTLFMGAANFEIIKCKYRNLFEYRNNKIFGFIKFTNQSLNDRDYFDT